MVNVQHHACNYRHYLAIRVRFSVKMMIEVDIIRPQNRPFIFKISLLAKQNLWIFTRHLYIKHSVVGGWAANLCKVKQYECSCF